MDDLISRQMLLEYIHGEPVGRLLCDKYNLDGLIKQFPSARPEKRTEERTEMHACDLISRAAAIERATKDHDFYKGATTPADMARRDELLNVMCWLGELPSAQPEQQWIPCSERLPEHTGTYLVTDIVAVDKYVTTGWYSTKGSWICDGYVEAWMPLPEPYKEK